MTLATRGPHAVVIRAVSDPLEAFDHFEVRWVKSEGLWTARVWRMGGRTQGFARAATCDAAVEMAVAEALRDARWEDE